MNEKVEPFMVGEAVFDVKNLKPAIALEAAKLMCDKGLTRSEACHVCMQIVGTLLAREITNNDGLGPYLGTLFGVLFMVRERVAKEESPNKIEIN